MSGVSVRLDSRVLVSVVSVRWRLCCGCVGVFWLVGSYMVSSISLVIIGIISWVSMGSSLFLIFSFSRVFRLISLISVLVSMNISSLWCCSEC